MVKARLIVRGYEEASNIQTDSPTVCRENLWLVSTTAVSNKWKIRSMDVKHFYKDFHVIIASMSSIFTRISM